MSGWTLAGSVSSRDRRTSALHPTARPGQVRGGFSWSPVRVRNSDFQRPLCSSALAWSLKLRAWSCFWAFWNAVRRTNTRLGTIMA